MNLIALVIAVAFGLMLAETRVSRAHERRLLAKGAVGPARDLFPIVAVLYPAILVTIGLEGFWRASQPVAQQPDGPAWFASGLLLFVASKALKYSAIRALGERWTFRILVLPGVPLVTHGPYRFVAHPNFIAVIGELAGAAMMCGARISGSIGVCIYALVLWMRARVEDRALKEYA